MAFISQAVAGATQYNGTANQGLLTFDLTNYVGLNWVPKIFFLALTLDGAAATIEIEVGLNGTAAVNRHVLANSTANSVVIDCPLVLGRAAAADIHQVYVTTTGKTAGGLLECVWFPHNAAR